MSTVIKVENISKCYAIGSKESKHDNLREVIIDTVKAPFRRLRSSSGGDSANEEDFWALKDVSFDVQEGDVVGIIGRNGAGKSTLLKILSKITEPTSGRIQIKGRIASLLEVGTGFHPELTGRENIYLNGAILGMTRKEINKKFDEIVDFSEIEKFLDTPVKRYSSGMYVRLAFAVAANLEPDILIIDEVLAVGDVEFQEKCLGKMHDVSNQGRTVLFVSHNINALQNLCTRGILLKNGLLFNDSKIDDVIKSYRGVNDKYYFSNDKSDIRSVKVDQNGDEINIYVSYSTNKINSKISLGFIVSDYNGRPIFGSNPLDSNISIDEKYKNNGEICINIVEPKLLNGKYNLSLWFGDGVTDFTIERDVVSFNILNMVSKPLKELSNVGHVYPKCSWHVMQSVS